MARPPEVPESAPAKPKTSGLAVASLVFGLAGLCTVGVSALVGLILGILALRKIRRSQDCLGGQSWAVGGIILSAFMVLFVPLVLVPAFLAARDAAYLETGSGNARLIAIEMKVYPTGHKNQLPPADDWQQRILANSTWSEGMFAYPPETGRSFAMNAKLSNVILTDIRNPAGTVLFFECEPVAPLAGGPELLPPKPRHGGKYVIAFVDGSVRPIAPEDIKQLQWEP